MSTARLPPDYGDQPIPEPPQPPRRRTKLVLRIAATILILAAGLVVVFVALLHNHSFRQNLLRITLPRISLALDTDVRIQDFSLRLSPTTPLLDLYNIAIDGTPPDQSPLLQADHLEIGLQIVSILKGKWYFNNVVVDRPVLRLRVDKDGNTNLPRRSTPSNGVNIFDLGIRHVLLRQGELYYNDRKTALDAALHDVELRSRFDPSPEKYSGRLSYQNGQFRFRNLNPMVHSLELEFEATPDTFTITHSALTTGASQVNLAASLNDYVHPKVNGTYQASLDSADLEQMLQSATLPSGFMRLVGSVQFQSDPTKPLLEALSLDGNMNSNVLRVHTATINTELRDISAEYRLHGGNIEIHGLRAQAFGGTLTGSYSMRDLVAAQQSELHAVLGNASLAAIQTIADPSTRKPLRVNGAANLTLEATWRKASEAFVGRAAADLKGSLASIERTGAFPVVPVDANIHVVYSAPAAEVTFTDSYFRMPKTIVKINGTVSRHQILQVQVQSDELHEVEAVANAFGFVTQPIGLYGVAAFTGTVRGSTAEPQVAGQLASPSLKIKGTEWRMLSATLDASPSHLALRNADVRTSDNVGRLTFDANVGLDRWSYTSLSPFQIDLNATQLSISSLKNLASSHAPIDGTVSARVSLRTSKDNIAGQGTITFNQVSVGDENLRSLTLNFQGNGDEVRAHLNAVMTAGSLQGDVAYFPRRKAYDGQVQATNINLGQLRSFRNRHIRVAGTLNLTAKGSGTIDDPGLDFTANVTQPQIENYNLSDILVRTNIANHFANIVLDSQAPSTLQGRGKVSLTGDYFTEATVDTATISLAPILAIYWPARAADLSGQTELHAVIRGPLKNPSAMVGQITLPTFSLGYRNDIQIANSQPIRLDYTRGVLTLQRTGIRGTGTDLHLEGSFPVTGTGPISLLAAGNIDLQLFQIISRDVTSSGQLEFNINGHGRLTNPDIRGQIKIVDASFAGSGIPLGLQKGNGVVSLVDDRLDIDQFQGRVSSGTFTARGNITYRPSVQLNLVMAADGIRLLFPPGTQEGIDTNLTLTGPLQSPSLKGQVRVNELTFTEAFDVEEALRKFAAAKKVPPPSLVRNLNLDVAVVSTTELKPTSSQLTLNAAANVRARGTVAEPALLGTVSVNSGELLFRGARYILKPSTVDFVNPSTIEPRLSVAVETRVQQYNVRLLMRGPIDQLHTTFSSEPPLPPADIINLVVFGSTNQPVTTDTTGNLGAVSVLASGVTNTVTERLQKIVGVSQLSIDPVLDNNPQGSTVGVTLRQRVTANLFVTFTSNPSSTQRQVIEVEYQATPRLSVDGVVNQNGGFAADVRIRKTW